MRQFKKPVSLLAALAMMVALLAGCGNGADPADNGGSADLSPDQVVAKAQENTAKAKSLSYIMTMDMSMSISANGEDMTMDMATTMEADMINDPLQLRIDTTMDMGEMGGSAQVMMYSEEKDGTITLYASEDGGESWVPQVVDQETLAQYDAAQGLELYTDLLTDIKEAGEETINGIATTQYTGVIRSTDMADVIRASGAAESFATLGLSEDNLDEMVADLGDMTFSIWIDKEKVLPVKYSFDMSDIMNSLTTKLMAAMGDQVAGLDMAITKTVADMEITGVDTITSIDRPDGLDAAA